MGLCVCVVVVLVIMVVLLFVLWLGVIVWLVDELMMYIVFVIMFSVGGVLIVLGVYVVLMMFEMCVDLV